MELRSVWPEPRASLSPTLGHKRGEEADAVSWVEEGKHCGVTKEG